MTTRQLLQTRLINQQIVATEFTKPAEIVRHLGAMQAQEFVMGKWAIGLRLHGKVSERDVQQAFDRGEILRTHIMRPTWHFVAPNDIQWMLALCGPRVLQGNASMAKKLELDSKIFMTANGIIAKALEGNNFLTREEIRQELEKKMKVGDGQRLAYIMMQAEQEALIASGPRKGKQFTYALLDERAPKTKPISRSEAVARLTERYFASRGPATVHDMGVWSGLTLKDIRDGVEALPKSFIKETIGKSEYIFKDNPTPKSTHSSFLMPDFDEYGMSYKDKSAIQMSMPLPYWRNNGTQHSHWLIVDGIIQGTWETLKNASTDTIKTTLFREVSKLQETSTRKAVKSYSNFINWQ